jgi:hypothetical protein
MERHPSIGNIGRIIRNAFLFMEFEEGGGAFETGQRRYRLRSSSVGTRLPNGLDAGGRRIAKHCGTKQKAPGEGRGLLLM